MAYATLTLKHKVTGKTLRRPVGRYNLMLLIGPFAIVAILLRGRLWQAAVVLAAWALPVALAAAIDALAAMAGLAQGAADVLAIPVIILIVICWFVTMRNVAQWDLRRLLAKGYEVSDFGAATRADVAMSVGRESLPVAA